MTQQSYLKPSTSASNRPRHTNISTKPANHQHTREPPSSLLQQIKDVLSYDLPPIIPSAFKFHPTAAAARHNMQVIISHGSVKAALEAETNSPLCYGSEFRPTRALDKLMCMHPLWDKTKTILEQGTISHFVQLPINSVNKTSQRTYPTATTNLPTNFLHSPNT